MLVSNIVPDMEIRFLPGFFLLFLGILAAVLVGNRAPAPNGDRLLGLQAVLLDRVRKLRLHPARVGPVVSKIEQIAKLSTRSQERSKLDLIGDELVCGRIFVSWSDDLACRETELVEVAVVPSGKPNVDGLRELTEGVAGRYKENPPGRELELLSEAGEKFDGDPQPSPSHHRDSIAIETDKEEILHVET